MYCRVMHILNSNSYSGAENVVIQIINGMKGYCDSTYVSPNGSIAGVLSQEGIDYYPVNRLSVGIIKRAIMEIQPDIIHAHDFRAGIYACATGTTMPIISHIHNNPPWLGKVSVKTLLYAVCCLRFKRILTVSDSVMDEFVWGQYFKNKTLVVGNPFNADKIKNMAEDAYIKDEFDCIFLGRITTPKNPLFFLDVIQRIKGKLPNIKVAVVGDGEQREEFENRIELMNLKENITIYGFLENPYGLLRNAKVMCMPSLWEGFGLAAVESLTLGTPVVCSGAGGLPGIVNDSNGKVCGYDVIAYADEILKLLTDGTYLRKKSVGAVESSKCFDNAEKYVQNLKKIYEDVLQ